MIRHPEEQRIGERRVDIATSHRREQLRKDNRYKDRRSRSEQVPDKPARQDTWQHIVRHSESHLLCDQDQKSRAASATR